MSIFIKYGVMAQVGHTFEETATPSLTNVTWSPNTASGTATNNDNNTVNIYGRMNNADFGDDSEYLRISDLAPSASGQVQIEYLANIGTLYIRAKADNKFVSDVVGEFFEVS